MVFCLFYPILITSSFFVHFVSLNPIIIRSGIVKDQGQKHLQDANLYDAVQHKGIANYEGEEGFNKNQENKFVEANDRGRYGEESGQKKINRDEGNFADERFHQEGGANKEEFGKKKAHKKGHHKSGYHNTYHKDESGSNSSYYDDDDDQGEEYVYDSKKGSYGDQGQQIQQGGHYDDNHYANDQAKQGHYDNAGKFEKDQGNRRDYNQRRYYDDRQDQNRKNVANQYGDEGHYNAEKYVEKPHYTKPIYYEEPHYNGGGHHYIPPPAKKTITIYEDPRVYQRDGYRRYEQPYYDDEYVQLDLRQAPYYDDVRYYDRRQPSYDYY